MTSQKYLFIMTIAVYIDDMIIYNMIIYIKLTFKALKTRTAKLETKIHRTHCRPAANKMASMNAEKVPECMCQFTLQNKRK